MVEKPPVSTKTLTSGEPATAFATAWRLASIRAVSRRAWTARPVSRPMSPIAWTTFPSELPGST